MTPNNIKTTGIFFVTVIFAVSAASLALAADQPACALGTDRFDQLKAVQNNSSLSYLEEIRQELAIRKQLLAETVDCAIGEASSLKTNLSGVYVSDPAMQNTKSRFIDQIDNAENYFVLQKSKINDLGLQGSKNFAKDLSDWRDGNYNPNAKNVNNLIVWTNNQPLIQSAQTRIDQISKTVTLLKIVGSDDIQNLWNDAQTKFDNAAKENVAAKNSLLAFSPPEESSAHVKSALDSLSSMYKDLLGLIDIINKSFPK